MLIAEQLFIKSLVKRYGKCNISTDGGTWYPSDLQILETKAPCSLIYHMKKA